MSNTRIRYLTNDKGLLISTRVFAINDVAYKVILNTTTFKYVIQDAVKGIIVAEGGNTKNVAVLKIQAKRALTKLGYTFQDEKRPRSGTSVPENN